MNIKNIVLLLLFAGVLMTACEEYQEENFNFDNSIPAYVELASGAEIALDTTGIVVPIGVQVRVALESDVNIEYTVTGDITTSGSVTIPATALSSMIELDVPTSTSAGTANLTLTAVDNGLSLGRGGPDSGLSATSVDISWTP